MFTKIILEFKSTLQYHDELNPVVWDDEKLKKEVRKKFLEIAKFWANYALIPDKAIKDIVITGGNANYNYTEYSDLDLHLIVNKDQIADCKDKILDEFLMNKKALWGLTHDIKIYGIPVEIYAQDISEKPGKSQGVYSVKTDKWVQKPVKEKVDLNDPLIQKKVSILAHNINYFIDSKTNDYATLERFKEKLKNMRSSAIKKGGEFSIENIVFKELRNRKLLDKFTTYILSVEDKNLSLKK
jgi:hypothetical protein